MASGTVYFRENRHVGLIRDISREGLFVYTDFKPNIGDTLRVVVNGRNEGFGSTGNLHGNGGAGGIEGHRRGGWNRTEDYRLRVLAWLLALPGRSWTMRLAARSRW